MLYAACIIGGFILGAAFLAAFVSFAAYCAVARGLNW